MSFAASCTCIEVMTRTEELPTTRTRLPGTTVPFTVLTATIAAHFVESEDRAPDADVTRELRALREQIVALERRFGDGRSRP